MIVQPRGNPAELNTQVVQEGSLAQQSGSRQSKPDLNPFPGLHYQLHYRRPFGKFQAACSCGVGCCPFVLAFLHRFNNWNGQLPILPRSSNPS